MLLTLTYCLIREESLDIVKEFRIGDLTSYSDHTILPTEKKSAQKIHKILAHKIHQAPTEFFSETLRKSMSVAFRIHQISAKKCV